MQEDFCLTYLECRNATEAYRQSYNVKPDTKPGSVWTNASKLMANPKVALRIAELEDQIAKITLYSVKQAHEDLETVKGLALKGKTKSLSAANRAISTQMKLHGLGVERHEFSGPDGGPIPLASISDDDLDREIARLAGITGKK
jgi:phage terminase small subunit